MRRAVILSVVVGAVVVAVILSTGARVGCCSGRDMLLTAIDRAVHEIEEGRPAEARRVLDRARRYARGEN